MAYYNKVGLLVLNGDASKFLVCQKFKQNVTSEYIMPGGKNDEGDDFECLANEMRQELGCEVDFTTVKFIGTYHDTAAGFKDRDVEIRLYKGKLIGDPKPSTEIEQLHWIGREAIDDINVSSIVRTKIIPDLIKRKIIH